MKKKFIFATLLFSTFIFSSGVIAKGDFNSGEDYITITFDANGGKFDNDETFATKQVDKGASWQSIKDKIPLPTYAGTNLLKWTDAISGGATIVDDTVFNADTTIYAQWGAADAKSFATDSWATLIETMKKGVDTRKSGKTVHVYGVEALQKVYELDASQQYGPSFIISENASQEEIDAKTRTVELAGLGKFNVRVIGENRDIISGSETKAAPLTFEFSEIVFPNVTFGSTSTYENSALSETLADLRYLFPDSLKSSDGLQKIKKNVIKGGVGTDKNNLVTFEDYLFPLSKSEMGQFTDNKYYEDTRYVNFENDTYPYYRTHHSDKDYIKYYNDKYIEKKVATDYLTRSPYTTNDNYIHAVKENGKFASYDCTAKTFGIAPAFAVGAPQSVNTVAVTVNGCSHFTKRLETRAGLNTDYYATFYLTNEYDPYGFTDIEIKVAGTDEPLKYGSDYTIDENDVFKIKARCVTGDITFNMTEGVSNFKADTWKTFVENADKGWIAFKDIYKNEYKANGNTFVGLKKHLVLKDFRSGHENEKVDYWVRVIGENADEDSGYNTACLTFEFTRCIDNFTCVFNDFMSESDNYYNSNLDRYLNSADFSNKILGDGSEGDALNVNSKIKIYQDDLKTYFTRGFFIASPSQMNLMKPSTQHERGAYDYYKNGNVLNGYKKCVGYDSTDNSTYWLRRVPSSPGTLAGTANTFSYDVSNPSLSKGLSYSLQFNYLPIAPLFCVGKTGGVFKVNRDIPGFTYDGSDDVAAVSTGFDFHLIQRDATVDGKKITAAKLPTTKGEFLNKFEIKIDGITITSDQLYVYEVDPDYTLGVRYHVWIKAKEDPSIGSKITGPIDISLKSSKIDCSWSDLVKIARYDEENNENGEFAKNYIPLGWYYQFNDLDGNDCKARVIGFNHDLKADSSGYTAITFEYDQVIGTDSTYSLAEKYTTCYDTENTYDFPNSKLNLFLNDKTDGYINKLPINMREDIFDVLKTTSISTNKDNEYASSYYTTKLFPLSFNECNGYFENLSEDYKNYVLDTSSCYDLYQGIGNSTKVLSYRTAKHSYHLRSMFTDTIEHSYLPEKNSLYIYNDSDNKGYVYYNGNTDLSYYKRGVRPAFCI